MKDETIFRGDFEEKIANNFETICTFSTAERNLSIWRTLYIMQYLQGKRRGERRWWRSIERRIQNEIKYNKENQEGISLVREEKFQFNDFLHFVDKKVCLTREILLRRDR